ncbi:MAG TPA: selenocysteine-specific translation elongation factor [Myxococcales bacterium]|nr:selenocysteine-specific translation elongation factor [Myxococcales bacterium]
MSLQTKTGNPAADANSSAPRGLVLGTAGHIDHGKTALIEALTGTQTDRLPEEKARGITIDLGFAALDLPGFGRLSVVDVPGHEGLVRTMVSGASGIDVLLLVVAADESVMPQTREHVAICDLLGIESAVVALTKTDLADEEMIELSSEEIGELLAPTTLADAPIVPVSAQSGAGLDALRAALMETAQGAHPRTTREGPPRLGVDRVFAMRGFGTVVTGTLVGAPLHSGDRIEVQPSGLHARIRGLQSHGQESKSAAPGTRCAVNLQGVEVSDLRRGDVITLSDRLAATQSADVHLHWLQTAPAAEAITSVEVLVGTAERRAHLAAIGRPAFLPGEAGFARLHVDGEGLALLPGDRFIVRGFAKNAMAGSTVGGGVVLDCAPPRRRRSDPALLEELACLKTGDRASGLRARIQRTGYAGCDARDLARETGLECTEVEAILRKPESAPTVLEAGGHRWLDAAMTHRLEEALLASLAAFHAQEPMRPGMPRATLRGRLPQNVPREAAELAIVRLESAQSIVSEQDLVRLAEYRPVLDPESTAAADRILDHARQCGLEPPSPKDWAEQVGVSLDHLRDLLAHLQRQGGLVRAPGDLWFAREAIDHLRERVETHFETEAELDTQTYKALIGTSRRTAMPLMELLDELHVTRRQGETRIPRSGGPRR